MPWRQPFINSKDEPEKEHMRQGTREQYQSDWIAIPAGVGTEFIHNLDEIPPVVHVIYSFGADGANQRRAVDGTEITLTYSNVDGDIESATTTLSVQNDLTEVAYFKVFAM